MICTQDITFEIGEFRLDSVSIEMMRNEYFVLLGPPGSGKSIFLECLCGLRKVNSGKILIDQKDITYDEPRKRNIGYVPQDYALFPHLTVAQNIAFGLRTSGISKKEAAKNAAEIAEMLGIDHLLKRSVLALSGGEKQRTALSRALVMKPQVLLLDEPVCALDEATRQNICAMLRRIQQDLQLTVMHVSHSLEEAFSVADRAAILNTGRLQQIGPLDKLLRKPANEFVARFMRCGNIFKAKVIDTHTDNQTSKVTLDQLQLIVPGLHEGNIKLIVRPEDVTVVTDDLHNVPADNKLAVRMTEWRDFGSFVKVHLEGEIDLIAHLPRAHYAQIKSADQQKLVAIFHPENIHVLK